MKLLMMSVTLLGFAFTSCSQSVTDAQVPSVVKNALLSEYADAVEVDWEKEKELYEADFKINQTEYEVLFDASGNLQFVKTEIPVTELPEAVTNTLAQKYSNKKIDEAAKIKKNGEVFYEVELEGKLFGKEIVLTQNGIIDNNQKF